jgi:hypothetical protein
MSVVSTGRAKSTGGKSVQAMVAIGPVLGVGLGGSSAGCRTAPRRTRCPVSPVLPHFSDGKGTRRVCEEILSLRLSVGFAVRCDGWCPSGRKVDVAAIRWAVRRYPGGRY